MSKFLASISVVALSITTVGAVAQTVHELAFLRTVPTVLAENGVFTSCGFRFFGATKIDEKSASATAIDGSITLTDQLFFLSKAGRFVVRTSNDSKLAPVTGGVQWIKIGADANFAPTEGKIIPGEEKGYHLFGTAFDKQKFAAFAAPAGSLWLSFSDKNGRNSVYVGDLSHSATAATRIEECITSMVARVTVELEEKSPPKILD